MKYYTIREVARMSGITTRTLRYYHQIGLLTPAATDSRGQRLYDRANLLRLQQILFFRELEFPLQQIRAILETPDFDIQAALRAHKEAIQQRVERLNTLIATLERTIASIQGARDMPDNDLFTGFDEKKYAEEARQRWGNDPAYAESQRRWKTYTPEEKRAIQKEGQRLMESMAGSPEAAPDSPEVQQAVEAYHAYIQRYFYPCSLERLRGLSQMWVHDPRFQEVFERLRPGAAEFVRQAVAVYCNTHA
ncbi:MAG: MerR family transcriptional regulator [Anaerolineae bacterium]|nr:MAG: MerR family transcriptional regulator [Anaerolineae bacterium]